MTPHTVGESAVPWTAPFSESAEFYDALYTAERDYAAQATRVAALARTVRPGAATVLDVACGTGLHLEQLRQHFICEGVDASEAMLRIAQRRNPGLRFHLADMRSFAIGRRYDVLICLFSSITYAGDLPGLRRTLKTFAAHLVPGGVCLVEPFLPYEQWVDLPTGHLRTVDLPDLTVAMVDRARRRGRSVVREVAYAVATPNGVRQVLERHTFGLFSSDEYVDAFRGAGFEVTFDPEGFDPTRGLYVARLRPRGERE